MPIKLFATLHSVPSGTFNSLFYPLPIRGAGEKFQAVKYLIVKLSRNSRSNTFVFPDFIHSGACVLRCSLATLKVYHIIRKISMKNL